MWTHHTLLKGRSYVEFACLYFLLVKGSVSFGIFIQKYMFSSVYVGKIMLVKYKIKLLWPFQEADVSLERPRPRLLKNGDH